MPGATNKYALPYPLAGDPVSDGDNQMKALADRLEYVLGHRGQVVVNLAASATGSAPVTWPTGISGPINVNLQVVSTGLYLAYPTAVGPNGMTVNVSHRASSSTTTAITVYWEVKPQL